MYVCLLHKGNFLFLNIIKTFLYIICSIISKLGHSPPTIDFCIWSEIEVDVHLFPEDYQKTAAFRERLPFVTALACVSIMCGSASEPFIFCITVFSYLSIFTDCLNFCSFIKNLDVCLHCLNYCGFIKFLIPGSISSPILLFFKLI